MADKMNDKFYRSNSHARLLSEYVPPCNTMNLMTSSFTQPRWSSISSPGYTPTSLHTLRPAQSSFYNEQTTTIGSHHPNHYSIGYKSCPRRSSMSFLHSCPTDTDSEPSMGAYGGHIIYSGVHLSDSDDGQHSSDEESPQKSRTAPLTQFDNVVCTCGASASNKARLQHELKRISSGVKDFKQCSKFPNNSSLPKDAATSPLNEDSHRSFSNDVNSTIINDTALATESANLQGLHLAQPDSANSEDDSNSSSTVTMANLPARHNSSASTLSSTSGPICRFCHLPTEPDKPLISPCRCSGTLRYIHASCLATWLEISMRKNRQKVPRCELCNFEYIRIKKFKIRYCRFPSVSRRDRVLHLIFLCSFLLMLASAVTTILCFLSDSQYRRSRMQMSPYNEFQAAKTGSALGNFNANTPNRQRTTESGRSSDMVLSHNVDNSAPNNFGESSRPGRPTHNFKPEFPYSPQRSSPPLTLEEGVTLTCGILFFLAFFVGMTVQIKSRHTIYQLLVKLIRSNMVWEIQDYDPTKDPLATSRQKAIEDKMKAQSQSSTINQNVTTTSAVYSAPSLPYQSGPGLSFPSAVTTATSLRSSGPVLSLYSPPPASSSHTGYSMLQRMSHLAGGFSDPRFPCPADSRLGCQQPIARSTINSNSLQHSMRTGGPARPYPDYYATNMPSSFYQQPSRHSMYQPQHHQCDPLIAAPHHEANFPPRPHVHRQVWTHASLYPGGISLSRHV